MLCLHKDCVAITDRKALEAIETPSRLGRWMPIPHAELANAAVARASANGLQIASEEWGVSRKGGQRLYGVLNFKPDSSIKLPEGVGLSMGLRSSIDKSVAIGVCSGAKVFVCDNGMMVGDFAIHKLHTTGFRLNHELDRAFARCREQASGIDAMTNRLKSRILTDSDAKVMLFDAFFEKRVMPFTYLKDVAHEYFEPKHEEFRGRNMWSWYNSVTEILKQRNPSDQVTTFRRLNAFVAGVN